MVLELLAESVEVLQNSPAQLERAKSLAALGAALRRSGQRAAARDPGCHTQRPRRLEQPGIGQFRAGQRPGRLALAQLQPRLGRSRSGVDITDVAPRDIYGFDLILLRPDMHIVWRGNAPPSDPATLAATVTGR